MLQRVQRQIRLAGRVGMVMDGDYAAVLPEFGVFGVGG